MLTIVVTGSVYPCNIAILGLLGRLPPIRCNNRWSNVQAI